MADEFTGQMGFQPTILRRRALRRRNTVLAHLIATVALVVSIAVVATAVTIGCGRAATVDMSHFPKLSPVQNKAGG